MSGVWVCPRKHSWRTQPADAEATLDVSQDCPICGEPGTWRSDDGTAVDATTAREVHRPTNVPGYEIHEEIGRGAMGVVYRARDVQLNRTVALKMILTGAHAAPVDRARFRREVESVAALQHPNILQIHSVGEVDGLPYCALEYIAGGTLSKRLKQGALPATTAARLIRTLARATHYAHQNGIIHRDLKPGNVLLRNTSAESADDKGSSLTSATTTKSVDELLPKIADFGLAKRLDSDMSLTGSSAVLGTPSNMAPEQADGRNRTITPAADVYGLGTILYECLAGRPVFKASSPLETLHQVLNADPPSLRSIDAKVPRDLETVCLKCLRKDPTQRYASAAELADDLDRFLAGEPVRARATGLVERAWRTVRRQNALLLVIAGAVALTLGVVALEKIGLIGGRSVYVSTGVEQLKPTNPDRQDVKAKVLAVTANGEIEGVGFLTSEKGVIQVSTEVLGMTEANSPRPTSLQVNIYSADGQYTAHDAEVALVEPRFKLALIRLLSGKIPEPAKPLTVPASLSQDALSRVKNAAVQLRVTAADGSVHIGSGCLAGEPGLLMTTMTALAMDQNVIAPPKEIKAILDAGLPSERSAIAELLTYDRTSDAAALRLDLPDLPAPLAVVSSRDITESQALYSVGFPTGAAPINWKGPGDPPAIIVKVRQTALAGRVSTKSGAVRFLQLEGGVVPGLAGAPIVNANGQIVAFLVSGITGLSSRIAMPADHASKFLRGRVVEITPGQAYELQQRLELPIEVRLADPLRRVSKLALEVWAGPPVATLNLRFEEINRALRDNLPSAASVKKSIDGPAVTNNLGAVPDPDRRPGEPRRYAGAVELPTKSKEQVYWARARYIGVDGTDRCGEAVVLPISEPVKRLPAHLGVRPFVPGETDVRLVVLDRSFGSGTAVFNSGMHTYHERWQERTPAGERLDFHSTDAGYIVGWVFTAPLNQILPHFKGLNGTLTATSSGATIDKLDVAKIPLAARSPVERINAMALENIYGFAIRSSEPELRPDDFWSVQTKLPITISQHSYEIRAEHLTRYQYLGRRQTRGRDEAIVTWVGRTSPQSAFRGVSRGAAAVDLETGRVRLAWRTIDTEYTVAATAESAQKTVSAVVSLDLALSRTFGPTEKPRTIDDVLPGRAIEIVPFVGVD